MRILDLFITVLISGFFSSAIAQYHPSTIHPDLCDEIAQYSEIYAHYGCKPKVQPVDDVEEFFREKCEENGSESSYDNAAEGLNFFAKCLQLVLDSKQIEADVTAIQSKSQMNGVFEKYCLRAPVLKECVTYATQRFKPCLKQPDELQSVELADRITSTFLEFVCYNKGERIKEFLISGGPGCVESKKDALLECSVQNLGTYIPPSVYDENATSGLGRLAESLVPSIEDCFNLENFRHCTVKALTECEDTTPAYLLNTLLNAVKNDTPCDNLPDIEVAQTTEIWDSTTAPENIMAKNQTFDDYLEEQCVKNSGPEAYAIALEGPRLFSKCVDSVLNMKNLRTEIEVAAQRGQLGTVFNSRCHKSKPLKKCVKHLLDSVKPCVEPEEQEFFDIIYNVTSTLVRFGCHRRGDRLTTFFNNGGLDCLVSKKEGLRNCTNQSFGSYVPSADGDEFSVSGLGRFDTPLVLNTQDCTNVKKFQQCTRKVLEECRNPSSTNLVDSMFKSIIKATPCKDLLKP